MDLGGSDRLGFRGSDRLNGPSWIRLCFDDHADAHGFEYHEFKSVCLSSVWKHTHSHNSQSLRISMFSNNVDLKTINRTYRKPSWILGVRE